MKQLDGVATPADEATKKAPANEGDEAAEKPGSEQENDDETKENGGGKPVKRKSQGNILIIKILNFLNLS